MPALAPVPKVVSVRLIGTDAADVELGTHFTVVYTGSAPTSANLATFGTAVGTAWSTNLAPLVDTGFTLTKVISVDLTTTSSGQAESSVSHAGTRAGTALPLNVAFTLVFPTNLRRRGGHWHCQLRVGVQADTATPQTWSTAFVGSVQSGWLGFIQAVYAAVWSGGGSLNQVGVQYYGPPNRTITGSTGRVRTVSTPLPVPAVWPVTGFNANTRLGSQRRRLGKSGG